jgi:hypothetical protein
VTTGGVRTASVSAANDPWRVDTDLTGSVTGTLANMAATVGQVTYRVSGDAARQSLLVTSPLRATVTLGDTITAAIDNDANGIAEGTLSIPWSFLLP